MRRDLAAARKAWLEEAKTEDERSRRKLSDFLRYKDTLGRYADFHANRHTFITNLGRDGVNSKTAQNLARHSDIRLTMNVYSHTDLAEKTEAVRRLPGLWECFSWGECAGVARWHKWAKKRHGRPEAEKKIQIQAGRPKSLLRRDLPPIFSRIQRLSRVRPGGFEPPTCGLEVRCSIQLSYGRKCLTINGLCDFCRPSVSPVQPLRCFMVVVQPRTTKRPAPFAAGQGEKTIHLAGEA